MLLLMLLQGQHRVVLEKDRVKLVPKRLSNRSEGVEVRYLDVVGISIVEPSSRRLRTFTLRPDPGRFVVRLADGGEIIITFPRRATLKMRAVQHHAWKRVRAARTASNER